MFCKYCGAKLGDDAVFCQSCGKPLLTVNDQFEQNSVSATQRNEWWYRLLLLMPLFEFMLMPLFILAEKFYSGISLILMFLLSRGAIIGGIYQDRREVQQSTGREISFDLVSLLAIVIFDFLYIDHYLVKRQQIIPATRRWPFYLVLILCLIIFFTYMLNSYLSLIPTLDHNFYDKIR